MKTWKCLTNGCVLLTSSLLTGSALARDFVPTSPTQVIEKLAPRTAPVVQVSDPAPAAALARAAITLARESADPRHLGRAQAMLAPWWDKPDAPPELATLQATILQSRHEFTAARAVLQRVVQGPGSSEKAQAWLTLATLDRLQADYPAAQKSCEQVARSGAHWYAQACQIETVSMQGRQALAERGFAQLLAAAPDESLRAWALSLQAEHFERAGQYEQAMSSYQRSLQIAPDGYTALAAADLWLRRGQAAMALSVLAQQPGSDSVLIRRAQALKLQNDTRWQSLDTELKSRLAALDARRDEPAAHARERALYHLWLDGDIKRALVSATLNLTQQREPIDWWLALESAERAGQAQQVDRLKAQLQQTGLRDARLAKWLTPIAKPGALS
jgi:tetratricopeptide (TPR) repeat protein